MAARAPRRSSPATPTGVTRKAPRSKVPRSGARTAARKPAPAKPKPAPRLPRLRGAERVVIEALTFDDVLLVPARSAILPREVDTRTLFSRHIALNIPLVSAAMDTVSESRLAIALAREGGMAVLHKNMTIEQQAAEVDRVKRSESGMITDPITLPPTASIGEALDIMARYKISGVPITEHGRLVGMLTNRDLRWVTTRSRRVAEVMTREGLVTAAVGTTMEQAKAILGTHRIEKLPVVDDAFMLCGLITVKDIQKGIQYPNAAKDDLGRLRVAAAVGATPDLLERAAELVRAGVDALAIDSAHGHSENVLHALEALRARVEIDIVAGNVATREAARDLVDRGADAIKVGMGPGSICTTRVIAGIGVPQITALFETCAVAEDHGVPVIADGGVKYSGDVVKAIAAGASCVMIGSLFAGTDESPGETVLYEGRSYKVYRAMGSMGAMTQGSRDRYFQDEESDTTKLVPEGIEGRVPDKGPLSRLVFQMVGGLRAGMGYCGVGTIEDLRTLPRFVKITAAGLRESHPHDVIITKESPNYEVR